MKKLSLCFSLVLLCCFFTGHKVLALDSKYNRNGEVYLMIAEGPPDLKGVYRFNNPENNTAYPVGGVEYISDFEQTNGFTVDLYRNIYLFTQNIPPSPTEKPYIWRQVVDDAVPPSIVDYGYHSYIHHDSRNRSNYAGWGGGTNIYRSIKGRTKVASETYYGIFTDAAGTGVWSGFGVIPPTQEDPPPGYKYPECGGSAYVPIYPGKKWYKIRNNSWYSCWRKGETENKVEAGYFYWCVGDKEKTKINKYYVNKWADPAAPNFNEFNPNYMISALGTKEVGATYEVECRRWVLAGCIDGCGHTGGNGTGKGEVATASVAFQPKLKVNTDDRAYFYIRNAGSTNYKLTCNDVEVPKSEILGKPDDLTTNWIGISLKDLNSDYVYALGTSVIKKWYKQYTNTDKNNMDISAVTVSNQWNQKGGIVFAHDRANQVIYKFIRDDSSSSSASSGISYYEGIDCSDLATKIGSYNTDVDDIKSDGFGSLYFGLSYPAKDDQVYDPRKYFKPKDAEHLHFLSNIGEGKGVGFALIFKQEYGKVVFKKDYLSGAISEVNRKIYAYKMYNLYITVPKEVFPTFNGLSYPDGSWFDRLKAAYNNETDPYKKALYSIGGYQNIGSLSSLNSSLFGQGLPIQCNCNPWNQYEGISHSDPGTCRLGVINIPTPPEVRKLGEGASYLDIAGAYDVFPLPMSEYNGERTSYPGAPQVKGKLSPSTTYYFAVENYPLQDGAQDPRNQPDWDEDNRMGGFVSSVINPASIDSGGGVSYEWKLWLVEDPNGNQCCELFDDYDGNNGTEFFPFWYHDYSKFILASRVKYNWYDYDKLSFGDLVGDLNTKPGVLKTNVYAWPAELGTFATMASATKRLGEVMATPDFSFMHPSNNPKDIEDNPINYAATILAPEQNKAEEFWALRPIICGVASGTPPSTSTAMIAKVERCDHMYGSTKPLASYIHNSHYWSPPPSSNTFVIEANKTFYWRMAVASQAKMFCDISKSTNITNMNANDFNLVAYRLSTETIDGEKNPDYVNSNKNVQFFPNELGSCWWRIPKKPDGTNDNAKIEIKAYLKYKIPGGETTKYFKHSDSALEGQFEKIDVLQENSLWQNNKPLYATMSAELGIPPTDPLVGTITIELNRDYYWKMWVIKDDQTRLRSIKCGPKKVTLRGEASVIILDTEKPTIVYSKTSPNNLFGLTGMSLAMSYPGETKTNPEKVSFTIRDNNAWEADNTMSGISLKDHVENYKYNYGSEKCSDYTKGSEVLEGYKGTIAEPYVGGIQGEIKRRQIAGEKTSHLNMKPMFSKAARDVRFAFDSAVRKKNGSMSYGRADDYLYSNGSYSHDLNLFDGDKSLYAYNPGIKAISFLSLAAQESTHPEGNTFKHYATSKYNMNLVNIKLSGGANRLPDGYANNTPGYVTTGSDGKLKINPYKFYVRSTDCSGNYTGGEKIKINGYIPINMALHVRDNIPPVAYGSVYDDKTKETYMFPREKGKTNGPEYQINENSSGFEYFAMSLPYATLLRSETWYPDNSENGYINGVDNYSAMWSYCKGSDKLIIKAPVPESDEFYYKQIENGLSPHYVEDNVECRFKTYANDNAGSAVGSLKLAYYLTDSRDGSSLVSTLSVGSSFVGTGTLNVGGSINASEAVALFRGRRDMFPMAIPITITAEDNAMDWHYYGAPSINKTGSIETGFTWGEIKGGASKPNKRVFKTSLPVFGSGVNVRVLEKTLNNAN